MMGKHYAIVRDGRLEFLQQDRLSEDLSRLADGQRLVVRLEKTDDNRTLAQNSLYHAAVVKAIADYMGERPNDVHDFLKAKFLPRRFKVFAGRVYDTQCDSTTSLSTVEFSDYVSQCVQFAAEQGLVLEV